MTLPHLVLKWISETFERYHVYRNPNGNYFDIYETEPNGNFYLRIGNPRVGYHDVAYITSDSVLWNYFPGNGYDHKIEASDPEFFNKLERLLRNK